MKKSTPRGKTRSQGNSMSAGRSETTATLRQGGLQGQMPCPTAQIHAHWALFLLQFCRNSSEILNFPTRAPGFSCCTEPASYANWSWQCFMPQVLTTGIFTSTPSPLITRAVLCPSSYPSLGAAQKCHLSSIELGTILGLPTRDSRNPPNHLESHDQHFAR